LWIWSDSIPYCGPVISWGWIALLFFNLWFTMRRFQVRRVNNTPARNPDAKPESN
jgi:hypothetical protein